MSTLNIIVNEALGDDALVEEAKAGSHNAFNELCRRNSKRLMASIRRILQDRWDAEEVLQDTLLNAFIHLKSFQGRSSVSTWMTRIAVNAALSRLRNQRGTAVSIDDAGEETGLSLSAALQDRAPDAERQLMDAQRTQVLAKSIGQMPASLRSVLELRIWQEYSAKQIAETMGISESAVKSRLYRAFHFLRERSGHRTPAGAPRRLSAV